MATAASVRTTATNVTIEHYVPGDGLRSCAVRRVRRCSHDHDQSTGPKQRAVVAGDDGASRRLRGREGRSRRAGRRAHRRGRQGVLRRRRPHRDGRRRRLRGPCTTRAASWRVCSATCGSSASRPSPRVRGYASPAASGSALACDLVVAADDAKFGTPEIDVGLWPFMITVPLMRSMPPKKALELMMTGRRVRADGGRAHRVRHAGRAGRPARRRRRRAGGDDGVEVALGDEARPRLLLLGVGPVGGRRVAAAAPDAHDHHLDRGRRRRHRRVRARSARPVLEQDR